MIKPRMTCVGMTETEHDWSIEVIREPHEPNPLSTVDIISPATKPFDPILTIDGNLQLYI